jgi:hypothetical protein
MKKLITFLLIMSFAAFAQVAIDKDIIIKKIDDNTVNLKKELLLKQHSSLTPENFNVLASKQKLANPKFKKSYLYRQFISDGTWRYDITFDYISGHCYMRTALLSDIKNSQVCSDGIIECTHRKGGVSLSSANECKSEISECSQISDKSKFEKIDKRVCDKIYK